MELWVRSQDKKILQKVSLLHIPNSRTGEDFGIYDIDVMLAHYKTKERALEVLDEMDEFIDLLNNNLLGMSDDGIHRRHSIYEMPEE